MHKLITKYNIRKIVKYYKKYDEEEKRRDNQRYIYDEYISDAINYVYLNDFKSAFKILNACLKDKKIDTYIHVSVFEILSNLSKFYDYALPQRLKNLHNKLHKLRNKCIYDF